MPPRCWAPHGSKKLSGETVAALIAVLTTPGPDPGMWGRAAQRSRQCEMGLDLDSVRQYLGALEIMFKYLYHILIRLTIYHLNSVDVLHCKKWAEIQAINHPMDVYDSTV